MRPSCLVIFVILGGARLAHAEDPDPRLVAARAHVLAGIAYYDEARYDEAAREMEAAYRLKPVPELQYNLGECYERLRRYDDAVVAYQRYLEGLPRSPDHARIEARIGNLRGLAADRRAEAPPQEKVVFKTIVVYRDAPPPPGRVARGAAWAVGVLGLAALASGIATAVLASQAADEVAASADPTRPPTFEGKPREAQSRGEALEIASGVSFGVAALAATGAVVLYLFGNKVDREAKRLSLVPLGGPGTAALALGGRF